MSYKLKYTGEQIDNILDRAVEGGAIDDALALKAPLESPALTGTPTAPTQAEGDDSTKVATTAYADRAADAAEAAAEAAAKEYTDAATGALYITDTASGSIASFSDGADGIPMRIVKASIEPVQDLHGQDAPYPPNGGKNKLGALLPTVKTLNTSGSWNGDAYTFNGVTFTFTTTSDGYIASVIANGTATANTAVRIGANDTTLIDGTAYIMTGCPSGGGGSTYQLGLMTSSQSGTLWDNGSGYSFTLSGTFTRCECMVRNGYTANNLTFYPMIRLASETDATFAPYSNECPISGWTGAEIPVTGINVWDEEWEAGDINATTGGNSPSQTGWRTKNYIPIKPLAEYYCRKGSNYNGALRLRYYDENKQFLSVGNVTNEQTFTAPNNAFYLRFATQGGISNPTYFYDISINYPSSDHDYHSGADNKVYSVSWSDEAGTVYGGHFVVNEDGSVDLTVENGYRDADGTEDVTGPVGNTGTYQRYYFTSGFPNMISGSSADYVESTQLKSDSTAATQSGDIDSRGAWCTVFNNSIRVGVPFATRDAFKQWLADMKTAGTPVGFRYKLATPQTYHLDSIGQITSLLGQNNVWSNTGDTEVTYVADPKLYIAKMLGGGALTLGSASPLSLNRPVTISEEDLEQAGEVNKAVEAAVETVLPAESGETEEGAQE